MTSAAAAAQLDGVEYLSEARLAAAVLRLAAGQALPTVCESGLRPTASARSAVAQAFAESVSMFASSDLCFFCLRSSPGTGTRQRPRQAKGKGNYRNWLQSLVTSP